MKKSITFIALITTASLLSACHKNPLTTHSKEKSIHFLIEASHAAGAYLNLTTPSGSYAYRDCMQSKAGAAGCDALLNAMVQFASRHPDSDFKAITIAELKDAAYFKTIEERYDETLFYTPAEEK